MGWGGTKNPSQSPSGRILQDESLYQRERLVSPFEKGGLRGI